MPPCAKVPIVRVLVKAMLEDVVICGILIWRLKLTWLDTYLPSRVFISTSGPQPYQPYTSKGGDYQSPLGQDSGPSSVSG